MNGYSHFFMLFMLLTSTTSAFAQLQAPLPVSRESDIADIPNYSGILSERYTNGSPALWKNLKNGKADGLWQEWYPDGTLRYRAYWKNGLGSGRWEYFHPNGQLRSESFYVDDRAYGIYRSYYENGQLQTDATYADDKKVGIERTYNSDGTLRERKRYENGRQVIDEPSIFEPGNLSNTQDNEWGIRFTPDGNTAYFTRKDAVTNKKRIYVSTKDDTGWSKPTIAPFSTDEDESPFVNDQGDKLFFASFRPLPDGNTRQSADMNIWYMNKTPDGWSHPQPIAGGINQSMQQGDAWPAKYEAGPITDQAGNLYYWAKGSASKATNLYFAPLEANGIFTTPIELIEPSSNTHFDSAPCLSPDGNLLFFASDSRPDSWGTDIFYARKINGQWSKPRNMGLAVNSYSDDSFPSFSPDGKYFFFSSNRIGNKDASGELVWDLFYVETRFLVIE